MILIEDKMIVNLSKVIHRWNQSTRLIVSI